MATIVNHAQRTYDGDDFVVGPARSRSRSGPVEAELGTARGRRAGRATVLAAGAVALVAVVAFASVATKGTPPATGTVAAQMTVADFAPRADDVCARLEARVATIGFRADTAVSDQADARSRIDALGQAAAALRSIGSPVTDPHLVAWVAAHLDSARLQAQSVLDAPTAAASHRRWALVDPAIDRAIAPLAAVGATGCGF